MPGEPNPPPDKRLELLEKYAKAAAGIGVLFYVTGMIVANQYLAKFDLSDFSSLKAKYVLTGVGTIFFIILTGSPGIVIAFAWDRMPDNQRKIHWLQALLMVVLGLLFYYGIWGERQSVVGRLLFIILVVALSAIASLVCVVLKERLYLLAIPLIFPFLACYFLVLSGIGRSFYGEVPEAFGGARPMNAELILNKDGASFWAQTGVVQNDCNSCTRTLPVKIIYQNNEVMVVQASYVLEQHEGQKLVIIRKPLVDAILPVPEK